MILEEDLQVTALSTRLGWKRFNWRRLASLVSRLRLLRVISHVPAVLAFSFTLTTLG